MLGALAAKDRRHSLLRALVLSSGGRVRRPCGPSRECPGGPGGPSGPRSRTAACPTPWCPDPPGPGSARWLDLPALRLRRICGGGGWLVVGPAPGSPHSRTLDAWRGWRVRSETAPSKQSSAPASTAPAATSPSTARLSAATGVVTPTPGARGPSQAMPTETTDANVWLPSHTVAACACRNTESGGPQLRRTAPQPIDPWPATHGAANIPCDP